MGLNFFAILLLPVLLRDLLAFVFDPQREEEFFFCGCFWSLGGKWRHNTGTPGTLFCGDSSCWMRWRPVSGTLNWTLTTAGRLFFCKYYFFCFSPFVSWSHCSLGLLDTFTAAYLCLTHGLHRSHLLLNQRLFFFFCVDTVALSKKKHVVVGHQLFFFRTGNHVFVFVFVTALASCVPPHQCLHCSVSSFSE